VAFGGLAVSAGVALGWFFAGPLHDSTAHNATESASESSVPGAPHFEAGAALRTANEKLTVGLEDGSKVTLAPRSRVAMQETDSADVALSLEAGRVACQVEKGKGRRFSVLAGDVTVRVIGTTFSVERVTLGTEEKVAVDVTEGVVEVEGPDGVVKRLGAGESWSVRMATEEVQAAAEAVETSVDAENSPAHVPTKVAAPEKPAVRDLFSEARAKRNLGDAAGAAQLYQSFLAQHPRDARSGVAALELGRLRMDQLGDPAGAIAPLTQAARGARGGLGDDALARLVRAHATLGQTAACKSARSRYLKSYPEGVHVERVRASCP
jgi:transmembrane sensor